MKKVVVLFSGGLDSTTCTAIAVDRGEKVHLLSFDYGQRHKKEVECAGKIAEYYGIEQHKVVKIDNVGGSALTDLNMNVPQYDKDAGIPITYVPARNMIFLSFAAGYAEVLGAEAIYTGVNAIDYSGYPDCRPEFIGTFEKLIELGTKAGVEGKKLKIETPLINMSKSEIIKTAFNLNAPLHLTTSCYNGKDKACGVCDSCVLRKKGFEEAGLKDPIEYEIY